MKLDKRRSCAKTLTDKQSMYPSTRPANNNRARGKFEKSDISALSSNVNFDIDCF